MNEFDSFSSSHLIKPVPPSKVKERFLDLLSFNLIPIYHSISPSIDLNIPQVGSVLNVADDYCAGCEETWDGHLFIARNQLLDNGKYRALDLIGIGTFSCVYKCQLIGDETNFFAIKILKNQKSSREIGDHELAILNELQNGPPAPGKMFLQKHCHSFYQNNHICIVSPLLSHPVFDGVVQHLPIITSLLRIRSIIRQLLLGVQYFHSQGCAHCDLKPDNILFSDETYSQIQIIDFGSAIHVSKEEIGNYIQARFYRSPEVMLGLPCTTQVDLWSIGCIAAELFTDIPLFACESEIECIHAMAGILGPFPDYLLPNASNWWKFFDATPQGFRMKLDPIEVITERHKEKDLFSDLGNFSLDSLIFSHKNPQNELEINALNCFVDFLMNLLEYDTCKRFNADEALLHPFISDDLLNGKFEIKAKIAHSSTYDAQFPMATQFKMDDSHHSKSQADFEHLEIDENDFLMIL